MSAEEFAGYGFAAGDVRGTRAFKVDSLGRLTGIVHRQVWRPGENLSECKRTRQVLTPVQTGTASPSMRTVCSCGDDTCNRYSSYLGLRHQPTYTIDASYFAFTTAMVLGGNATEPDPCEGMDPECKCGFYGYQEGSNDYYKPNGSSGSSASSGSWASLLIGSSDNVGTVGGVVRGYGKTVLGTRGFRSEKAQILALFVESGDVKRVALKLRIQSLYTGIPVFTDYEAMLRDFPPTPPEGYGSASDDDFWTRAAQ